METQVVNDMLNLSEPILFDNSIESYDFNEYVPSTTTNFNIVPQTIQIDVQATDSYYRPSHSYIYIEGKLVKNDDTRYAVNDQVSFINNGIMYLFSSIEYSAGGKVMETLNNPGQTTSMLGYLSYPDDFNSSYGLSQCWNKDTTVHANSNKYTASQAVAAGAAINANYFTPQENPQYNQGFASRRKYILSGDNNTRGNFSFVIPFSHIFGFSEYDKVLYNIKHTLKFTRASDNLAIHRSGNADPGKIVLTHIAWRLPCIDPSVETKAQLMQMIKNKKSYPIHFGGRSDQHNSVPQGCQTFDWRLSVTSGIEKPRWILVGFQTDKNQEDQTQNPAVFDHLNLDRAYVQLNSERFPKSDIGINFASNQYSILYKMTDDFKREYFGMNSLVGGSQINLATYKSLYPILVFDVRNQSEKLRSGVIDIVLKFYFKEIVPANTHAFAVIISDRVFKLDSDGLNMKMVSY